MIIFLKIFLLIGTIISTCGMKDADEEEEINTNSVHMNSNNNNIQIINNNLNINNDKDIIDQDDLNEKIKNKNNYIIGIFEYKEEKEKKKGKEEKILKFRQIIGYKSNKRKEEEKKKKINQNKGNKFPIPINRVEDIWVNVEGDNKYENIKHSVNAYGEVQLSPGEYTVYYVFKDVTDLSYMFADCINLKSLDMSKFNTINVKDMSYMCSGCENLKTIILGEGYPQWNQVSSMRHMFELCSSLTNIKNLNDFYTQSVTDMSYMFCNCYSLSSLNVDKWNTLNVENMSYMFAGCCNLNTLDVSKFKTHNVTDMSYMFYNCKQIETIKLWETTQQTLSLSIEGMFKNCSGLKNIENLDKLNTKNVTNMSYMFYQCNNLTTLDVSKFDTRKVTDMSHMFHNCYSLTTLDVSKFDTPKVTNMSYMFYNCYSLTTLDVTNFDTQNVKYMRYMFAGCDKLKSITLKKSFFCPKEQENSNDNLNNDNNKKHIGCIFYGCSNLKIFYFLQDEFNLQDFIEDVNSNIDFFGSSDTIFSNCKKLKGVKNDFCICPCCRIYREVDNGTTFGMIINLNAKIVKNKNLNLINTNKNDNNINENNNEIDDIILLL